MHVTYVTPVHVCMRFLCFIKTLAIPTSLTNYKLVGGRWGGAGRGGGGEEGGEKPQVKTQGHQSPSNGPDHPTRPKGHHSGRG